MTVDDYLGRAEQAEHVAAPATAARERRRLPRTPSNGRSRSRAKRIAANPRDADAHYQLGAAVGLRASYTATVEGSVMGAFRAAREAYDEHEKVLSLGAAPQGRRVSSSAPTATSSRRCRCRCGGSRTWPASAAAGSAACSWSKKRPRIRGENQTDARFALMLLYNREKRYDEALKQLATLREDYPRNRLVWLESGSTALRAGRPADAERFLNEGFTRFADDRRPRMFGEHALWHYKRGAARAGAGPTRRRPPS